VIADVLRNAVEKEARQSRKLRNFADLMAVLEEIAFLHSL
jgi:hypothetical protein